MSAPDETTCHRCGAEADAVMGEHAWCLDCLQVQGSCCAGEESEAECPADD